jgi:hypothetical protein
MNSLNFEDTVYVMNMRIRMIRDTLRLSAPPGLFLEKTMDDLGFINVVLTVLVRTLKEKNHHLSGNGEFDNISDAEWQFNQLLTEVLYDSGSFFPQSATEIREKILSLRENSNTRRKELFASGQAASAFAIASGTAQPEPVVSSAELSGLLGA